jgi:hypothetical protein
MLLNDYPVVSSNLYAGYGIYGTADPYNASLPDNGALNPPGSLWVIPAPSQSSSALASSSGYGSYLVVKYVLYSAAAAVTMVAGPAPVYYTDTTLTTVSGKYADGLASGYTCAVAGFLLPNTGSVTGIGIGTAVTSTILYNSGLGSWVFIAVQGFVPSCAYFATGAIGSALMGDTAQNFELVIATNSNRVCGYCMSAVSSNVGDVLVSCGIY